MFDKKEWSKQYYLKRKNIFKARAKKQHESGYHDEHKNSILDKQERRKCQLRYKKRINYSDEKTPEQRKLRSIKRMTRYKYPLLSNTKCELCNLSAECHHHNTSPIKINKFNFFCNKCHNGIHKQLNLIGGQKKWKIH